MTKDLTTGKIRPLLIKFTIPIILGNLFQLTYNAADSVIVGRFVGKRALAAVGICNPLMTLAILFINGMCMGAAIIMGNQYGARDFKTLRKQISTTMLAGLVFSLAITLLFIGFAKPLLTLMQVHADIMELSVEYLRVVFCGVIFTFMYNFYAGTLRALGDSSTPLYFLIISAVLNIGGDLFFVIVLKWGSGGCALATVLSEAICCMLCGLYIKKNVPILNLGRDWLRFEPRLLKKTLKYGWASAMQQATVQLGKIGIQTIVNTLGISATAAFTAVNRIDDYSYTPEQNIGNGMTTLMAQNHGAGKTDRVRQSFFSGMRMELAYGILIGLICFIFANPLMHLFSRDQTVITHGVKYLRYMAFLYIMPAISNGLQGYFRGIGDLKVTLLSSFVNMGVRVIVAVILVFVLDMQMEALPLSYLAGWIGMLLTELPLLIHNYRTVLKPGACDKDNSAPAADL